MTEGEKMAEAADRMVSLRDEVARSGPDPRIPSAVMFAEYPSRRHYVRQSNGNWLESILLVNHDGFEKKETCHPDEKYLRVPKKVSLKGTFASAGELCTGRTEHLMCFERSLDRTPDGMAIFREMEL